MKNVKTAGREGTPSHSPLRETSKRGAALAPFLALLLALPGVSSGAPPRADTRNRMALEVLEPPGRAVLEDVPVSVGVVFPDGAFAPSDTGRLVDDRGQAVPLETQVTGWWGPDRRFVKWLLLKFPATTNRRYWFEYPAKPVGGGSRPVAEQAGEAILVNTGPLQAEFKPAPAYV